MSESGKNKIRVFLVDDHPIVRSGVKSELQKHNHIFYAGDASSGKEGIEKINSVFHDIVLLDISMPGLTGFEVAKILRKKTPQIKLIVLTMHNHESYINKMISLGVKGYLLKNADTKELLKAIELVYKGGVYYSTSSKSNFHKVNSIRSRITGKYDERLTVRESEVLKLIADGYSNKETAKALFISCRTVDTHRLNIMHKLNIKNFAGLVKYAIEEGII